MAWDGWFSYGGNEIVNVARTEAYLAGTPWFRPQFKNDSLPVMLGDGERYTTPLHDDAPWVDPDDPSSLDFYGFYPLGITGIEDSTRTSSPVESLNDGGVPGRVRNAMRSVVFNGLLLARTEAGAAYGMSWLKRALDTGPCGAGPASICNGLPLCYLTSEPDMDLQPDPAVSPVLDGGYFGTGHAVDAAGWDGGLVDGVVDDSLDGGTPSAVGTEDVDGGSPAVGTGLVHTVIDLADDSVVMDGGPVLAGIRNLFDGGEPATVVSLLDRNQITPPFDISLPPVLDPTTCLEPYLRTLMQVVVNNGPTLESKAQTSDGGAVWNVQFTALAGNPAAFGSEVRIIEGFLDPNVLVPWAGGVVPEGGAIDLDGFISVETSCANDDTGAIYDPLYPAAVLPPPPPNVPLGQYIPPVNWHRRQFTIPKQFVPSWGDVVPVIAVHARTATLRNLRVRFYADPYKVGDTSDDPCAYCGDIVVSYVPQDHTLVLDGVEQTVYVIAPGGARRRADSLVFATDGTPFEWPALSCGFGYVVTLDLPQTQEPPVVDLSLYPRAV